jgi:hypothetical protein
MAGNATDVVLQMYGIDRIHVLRPTGMTGEAVGADFLRRCALERENFGLVATALDVGLPGAVATFATLPLRAFLRIEGGYEVRRILKTLEEPFGGHVCVARLARLGAYIERGIRRRQIALLIRFVSWSMPSRLSTKRNNCSRKKEQEASKKKDPWLLPLNVPHQLSVRMRTP